MITSNAERAWHTAESEYDSLPILFRRQSIKVSEFPALSVLPIFISCVCHAIVGAKTRQID